MTEQIQNTFDTTANDYMGTEKISALLLKFSVPCVLSLLTSALYNIVDQIFIGNSNVGAIGNTATSIVFSLTCVAFAFALMLGDGTATYISLCLGRKETDKPAKAVGTCITVSVIISIIFLVVCLIFLEPIMIFLGAKTPEALEASMEYGRVITLGLPFYILLNMLNSILRADGKPMLAFISMGSGTIINIVLDAWFIFGLNMGLTGAALATVIGQAASCIINICGMIRPHNFHFCVSCFKIDLSILKQLLKMGFSSFLTQISIVIITVVSVNMLAKYGAESKYGVNDPQAIYGIVMKVFSIFVNIGVGITAGALPVIGYNFGASNIRRVKKLFSAVMALTLAVGIIATIILQLVPEAVISIFGTNSADPEMYTEFGVKSLRIYLMLIAFTLIVKDSAIFLQSIGNPLKATIISMSRDIIFFVPATIIFAVCFGIEGILWAAPFTDALSLILTVILLIAEFRKISRL